MEKTLAEIARLIGGEVVGNEKLRITGLSSIQDAQKGDITFIAHPKYTTLAKKSKASALITSCDVEIPGKSIIRSDNPSLAFARLVSLVTKDESRFSFRGIHKTAVIAQGVSLGKDVHVGPYAIIESKCSVGDGTVIYGGCYIGHHTQIGKKCLIYPHVTIREHTEIGHNVVIHCGTIIGSDGFGYEQEKGVHKKIPQIGTVLIEDDVEIGANVAVDRARLDKTIIGRGTKIDNLVQIGHNVVIGEHCLIVAQVGISGSSVVGRRSILAGQAGVVGHVTIGEGSVVAAQSAVAKSFPPFSKIFGTPARNHSQAMKANAAVLRLPEHIQKIKKLERRVQELEAKLKNDRQTEDN